jgi:hypothetical protein
MVVVRLGDQLIQIARPIRRAASISATDVFTTTPSQRQLSPNCQPTVCEHAIRPFDVASSVWMMTRDRRQGKETSLQ